MRLLVRLVKDELFRLFDASNVIEALSLQNKI